MNDYTIAYLGPPGTFSQEAALAYVRTYHLPSPGWLDLPHVEEVLAAVAEGRATEGVVPLENSLEGSVAVVLDCLRDQPVLRVRAEVVVSVQQALLGLARSDLARVQRVLSHPQALAQCRRFLQAHLPGAQTVTTSSTAAAAATVARAGDPNQVAIASVLAAQVHGLVVLEHAVQDQPENATRFVVVGRVDHEPTGRDKTSLVLRPGTDRPGLLHQLLGDFARYRINLTRIESRPARRHLGEYDFFVDCVGHRRQPPLSLALADLARQEVTVQVLGSYPQWRLGGEDRDGDPRRCLS